jgi:hypothetical protein
MLYLKVDAFIHGTGIKDIYKDEYVDLSDLISNKHLCERFCDWVNRYQRLFPYDDSDAETFSALDTEGKALATEIMTEHNNCKIEYYSDFEAKGYVFIGIKWYKK